MIYVTGDLHRDDSIKKLSKSEFPEQKTMTKADYLIVAGDFGMVWDNSEKDKYLRQWLDWQNYTILFADGNHENFDLLDAYPVSEWNGGKVHFITDSIIHLMRGQVFTIDGVKIFTFGGAPSIDKEYRIVGKTWWAREMPSYKEMNEGLNNLEKHDFKVDFIITHDCSLTAFNELAKHSLMRGKGINVLTDYLEEIEEKTTYKHWYFGHYHEDLKLDDKHTVLYLDTVRML